MTACEQWMLWCHLLPDHLSYLQLLKSFPCQCRRQRDLSPPPLTPPLLPSASNLKGIEGKKSRRMPLRQTFRHCVFVGTVASFQQQLIEFSSQMHSITHNSYNKHTVLKFLCRSVLLERFERDAFMVAWHASSALRILNETTNKLIVYFSTQWINHVAYPVSLDALGMLPAHRFAHHATDVHVHIVVEVMRRR